MVFKICNKCRGINIKTLLPKLEELNKNAKIEVGCQNFCGVGRRKPFVIVNHIPIIADSEDELITKVKDHLTREE